MTIAWLCSARKPKQAIESSNHQAPVLANLELSFAKIPMIVPATINEAAIVMNAARNPIEVITIPSAAIQIDPTDWEMAK